MARYNPPTQLDRQAVSDIAAAIRKIADDIDGVSNAMKTNEMPTIYAKMVDTGTTSIENLTNFAGEMVSAFGFQLATRFIPSVNEKRIKYDAATETRAEQMATEKRPAKKKKTGG